MINYLKKIFALSDLGAKNLVKGILFYCATDIGIMLSIGVLYLLLTQTVIYLFQGGHPVLNVWVYICLSAAVIAVVFILSYLKYNYTYLASYTESAAKRISLAEKLRKLPLSFFGQRDLSDLTTTIMTDCAGLETAYSHYIPEFISSIISTFFVCIALFIFEWRMGIALVWVIPISFLIVYTTRKYQDNASRKTKEVKLDYVDGIQECIENIKDIKSYNQSKKHMDNMKEKLTCFEKSSIKTELTVGVFVVSAQMLLRIGIATTMLVGADLLSKGEISLLIFLGFMMAATRVFDPVAGAFINLGALFNSLLQINRMKEIENHPIQSGTENASYNGYNVCFDNVGFAYNTGKRVLNEVSFIAKQGEVTALVGPSGGGKSTTAKLAARFWDVTQGKITLGGTDISTIEPETLLKNFSIVFQDVVLFNNTIMENIRLGKKGASDEEVYAAAKAAQCHQFISNLPDGYNTLIGENGGILSGGERQRISIARALLKDAPVILLDEATASLDVDNETLIQSALSRLIKNKTVLIIAHRMRTVGEADKIVVLENGYVVEMGSPAELIKKDGHFKHMTDLQTQTAQWTL